LGGDGIDAGKDTGINTGIWLIHERIANMKTRMEVRLDADINKGLKKLAKDSDISVNQLVEGVLRWAVKYGQAGFRPVRLPGSDSAIDRDGEEVFADEVPGCIYFGHDMEIDETANQIKRHAELYFWLDYSGPGCLKDKFIE
jgi:hypothetical protein